MIFTASPAVDGELGDEEACVQELIRAEAQRAIRQEKFILFGRYPSFAHMTISSLEDFREFAHRVAINYVVGQIFGRLGHSLH